MRITTVGVLATLGMILTSTAVWSATAVEPGSSNEQTASKSKTKPKPDDKTKPDTRKPDVGKPLVDKSTFVSGKTLMIEGRLGQAKMLADEAGETLLFVDVRSDQTELDKLGALTGREPLNLAIVIDHSGSMKGQRARNAFDAAAGMVQRLRDGDTVSIVTYSDEARTVVPVTTVDSFTRAQIVRDMQFEIADKPSGHTCVSCGLELGMRTLEGRRAGVDRLLLLSDGEANRGVQDEAGIRVLARQARNDGTTISSIGVDIDYNERLMSAIAREANGRHYFSETGENLEQIFDQELESLVTALAKDAQLVVELAPGVRVAEVLDRSYQQVDRRVIVPMGTFAAGEAKTFLLRLDVPASPIGERPIASVSFTYKNLINDDPGECFGELAAQMIGTADDVSSLDAIVANRLSKSETARTLEQANELFAEGRTEEAQAIVEKHREELGALRQVVTAASGAAGFSDPFDRNLEDDFDVQADALDSASVGFNEAIESAPAAGSASSIPKSAPAKKQFKRNAEQADAFSL